ncbi:MAG: hypothetical protein G01um10143_638 [Parcubacteria group bacterium Gr01-1014_3]|nr:MAG: hypothetical protein G01um10143_638 [Parcubacteria group bacterium Gr01-1014_3]
MTKRNKVNLEPLFRVNYRMRVYDPTREEMSESEREEIINAATPEQALEKAKEKLEIIAQRTEQDFGASLYEFTNFLVTAICPHCRGTGLA